MKMVGFAAIAVVSSCLANQAELVIGGDFEGVQQGAAGTPCHSSLLPGIPGWNSNAGYRVDRFGNQECPDDYPLLIPMHAGGGLYSISLQGSVCCGCNNNGYIEQLLPTEGGTRYRLTFDAALDESDLLRISMGPQEVALAWEGSFEWFTYSFEFSPVGPTMLRFESMSQTTSTLHSCGGCWEAEGCVLDNISVVALPACPADVIENGIVDGADLAAVLTVWGTDGGIYPRADANGDGVVNGADLAVVLGAWGVCQ